MAYYGAGHGRRMVIRQFAFLERYGHQPISELKRLTIRELNEHAEEVGELVKQERESFGSDLINPD